MQKFTILIAAATALLLLGLSYSVVATSADNVIVPAIQNELNCPKITLAQYGFDREACEQDCRSRYGVDPYELQQWSRPGRPGYWAYASCIQQCNTRYWKEFDRRMRDLERDY